MGIEQSGKLGRILIVDDDGDHRSSMARYLSTAGFSVITCADGDEAIAALEGLEFNAVLSDVQMPRVNGLSLVEWVAANRPAVKILLMTAFGSSEVYKNAMRRGAALYLEKPVDPKLLVEILHSEPDGGVENATLVSACLEAEKRDGHGEVIVRLGDLVGRVYFVDGRVAWAAVSNNPAVFLEALYTKTDLERDLVRSVSAQCREDGTNIVDRLVEDGFVPEGIMRAVLLHSIAACIKEMGQWSSAQAMYLPVKRPFVGRFTFSLSDVLRAVGVSSCGASIPLVS